MFAVKIVRWFAAVAAVATISQEDGDYVIFWQLEEGSMWTSMSSCLLKISIKYLSRLTTSVPLFSSSIALEA
jgi:hypothetical protein